MEMLEIISLKGFENRKPDALSAASSSGWPSPCHGQPAQVLLLDEPLARWI
jgi:ABC-type nitrate/sulfonate/bicarbonate transport system ATPase subunit